MDSLWYCILYLSQQERIDTRPGALPPPICDAWETCLNFGGWWDDGVREIVSKSVVISLQGFE